MFLRACSKLVFPGTQRLETGDAAGSGDAAGYRQGLQHFGLHDAQERVRGASRPIVDGKVGRSRSRLRVSASTRAVNAEFVGSPPPRTGGSKACTRGRNRPPSALVSWRGGRADRSSPPSIPPKTFPQPPANSVSPLNNHCRSRSMNTMWPLVWPGTARTESAVPKSSRVTVSPSPTT